MTYRMIIYRDTFSDYINLVNQANSISKRSEQYPVILKHIKEIEREHWYWIVTYSPTQEYKSKIELFCE